MSAPVHDDVLMARLAGGDQAAARLLVARTSARVVSLAERLLRDRTEAEDVAQDAFVRLWRQAPRWEPGRAKVDTWLYAVVLNLCRDRQRRRRPLPEQDLPDLPDPADDADERLIDAERDRQVAAEIHALADRQRDAILLVHYADCTGAEAAAILGISIEALESLLARGRRRLRSRLIAHEESSDD